MGISNRRETQMQRDENKIHVKKKHKMDRKMEACSGEDNVFSLFFYSFFTGQLMSFFFFHSFFFRQGSQNWIARVKPPGVSPSLSTALIPYMHSVTIIIPGWMPGSFGSFTLLQSEQKYVSQFLSSLSLQLAQYLFIKYFCCFSFSYFFLFYFSSNSCIPSISLLRRAW